VATKARRECYIATAAADAATVVAGGGEWELILLVLVHHGCLAHITSLIEEKFFVGSRQALSTILAVNSRRRQ
jgi:hypothetical protein